MGVVLKIFLITLFLIVVTSIFAELTALPRTTEKISYQSSTHERGVGETRDGYNIFVDVFLSIKSFFEPNIPESTQWFYTWTIELKIARFLRSYIYYSYLPQFAASDIHFCQTEFYNRFMYYMSDQLPEIISKFEGLNSVRITRLEIEENPFSRDFRLQEEADGNSYRLDSHFGGGGVTSDGHLIYVDLFFIAKHWFNTPQLAVVLKTIIIYG